MARRFYQPTGDVPAVSPAFDAAWTLTGSAVRRRMMTVVKTANDAVANGGAIASNASGDVVLHRQYVSDPMNAGLVFDTSTTYKCYLQALESAINDNAFPRMGVRIVSYDGSTVRATLLAVADYSTPTEFNTALRNKIFANGDTGTNASYTTQTGDRLVVELGHGGLLQDVRERLLQAQEYAKRHYDGHHRTVEFAVGDWVLLRLLHRPA